MKKTLGLAALLLAVLFVGGCTLTAKNKDNINYNSSVNEEQAEAKVNINDEATAANGSASNAATDNQAMIAGVNVKVLNIVSSESEAKYSLNEILSGVPTFVVGTTKQISGQISIDTSVKPAAVVIGEVRVDATTFKTDKEMRDNNVVKLILKSNEPENQYIVFKPTNISGVPETITPDQAFPVEITGNLTISGVMKPTTFSGTMTLKSDGSVVGEASTDLTYANFGLEIPNFPFLANVDKVVKLNIAISAK